MTTRSLWRKIRAPADLFTVVTLLLFAGLKATCMQGSRLQTAGPLDFAGIANFQGDDAITAADYQTVGY